MTISSTNRRAGPYSGNSSQTAFPFSFKVFEASDMLVVKVQVSTNIETTLALTTDYTVALNADQNSNAGGTINLVTALPTGYNMVISSKVAYLQETDLTNQGGFYPEVITDALDRLTIEAQQLKEGLDRAAQLPITSAADAAALVADIERIASSADNLDTVATNIVDVNTVADDIADVTSVADNISNVNAVAANETNIDAAVANATNINAAVANEANIDIVAGINANVTTVAGISANVTTVAGIAANVTSVAGNATNINAVAGNATNINAVNANKTNIDTVAGINANVTTVAGISADVTAVAADTTDIGTVATNIADVNTVATDIADINTCADNMAAILDAPAQASAAAASAAAAAASLDNFDDRYLGSKATAPTVDNDGNPLVAGALYFNNGTIVTDDKGMWVYDGGTWIAASAASQAILVKYKYVATAGQTSFSGTDANGLTLSYTAGSIIVTLNGVVMDAADYTATTGNSVVLGTAAALNDELGVFAFSTFDIANTYTQAQVDAFAVKLTGDQTIAGTKTFSSEISAPNTFGFKNRIINGGMVIDQRNAGASVTVSANPQYMVDRWQTWNSPAGKFAFQQTPFATETGFATRVAAGFTNYLGITSNSAYSITSLDYFAIEQCIEGNNIADFAWGTSDAKTVTISFWVRSSLTGTFGGYIKNSAANRSYVFSYTISAANTWEQKTITIAGDTTGTWLTTNGIGLRLGFSFGAGSANTAAAGSWGAGNYSTVSSQVSVVGTNGATFYITGVQLEKGTQATSFDFRSYGTELALCQRYYQKLGNSAYAAVGIGRLSSTRDFTSSYVRLNQNMRSSPSVSISSLIITDREGYDQDISAIGSSNTSIDSIYVSFNHSAIGVGGQPTIVAVKNGTSGFIAFSAEL